MYTFFDRFVFRSPLYAFDRAHLADNIDDPSFDEALFLASPELRAEWRKGKADAKMEQSLYKYVSRASTRCTPFGLFAGCSAGRFGDQKKIELVNRRDYRRVVRFDMQYLASLVEELEGSLCQRLKFTPNDSVYPLGSKLRYVEYAIENKRRVHKISCVDPDDYLTAVLEFAASGKHIGELVDFLTDDDIEPGEAREYVGELIAAQLLRSELQLGVTGDDALKRLIAQLGGIDDETAAKLQQIETLLADITATPVGDPTQDKYQAIISIVEDLGVAYEPKFLFQCDTYKPVVAATLPAAMKDELGSLFNFLHRITPLHLMNSHLQEFRDTFVEYYEEREMPLSQLLDSELGIGFAANGSADEPNELLQGLGGRFELKKTAQPPPAKSVLEPVLFKKYLEYVRTGGDKIVLDDADIKQSTTTLNKLPATMDLMCSLVGDKCLVKSFGDSCGANILGRFGHLDPSIADLCREITAADQRLNPDVILAEIVHLPEARTGNILCRPVLRDYEIPYLAHPAVDAEFQIALDDLMVSVRDNRIVLRSQRIGKEIVPRLATAHNYSANALPVYRFLCELQTQNLTKAIYFNWGERLAGLDHYPRVEYRNFILSRAKWTVAKHEFPTGDVTPFLEARGIPQCVIVAEGDNEQYVDFADPRGVELFRAMLDKKVSVQVEEFLFDQVGSPIEGGFCNEFIFICRKS